ncbi:hypothetical protein LTR62_004655 [Meristemomyces frigidus]|uniref:SURF1-like protein n=1 Tax=Meristemomyces frigidus TaxID=1508187 RepID=A0AAN7YRA8_9PEZI|nr:hypothetical protein LTR62_004655 [Meristemomyces frigidus]
MDRSTFVRQVIRLAHAPPSRTITTKRRNFLHQQCLHKPTPPRLPRQGQRRHQTTQPADDPAFKSIVDNPPTIIRAGRKHNRLGLAVLAAIPITAFILGCWQVQRLTWKTDLIARFEDRLVRDPLPLPPVIDPEAVTEFDYRRVYARGVFRHEREMLIGPRIHDGEDGYLVVTPLDRSAEFKGVEGNSTVLVNRGWVSKDKAAQSARQDGLPRGEVVVEGLLREPWKKNTFTPDNDPARNLWHFPDVHQMAEHSGSQAVWIEETMPADLLLSYDRSAKGIPIGRPAEVNLRNNHVQYIFTWFSLSLATTVMMWMVVKKPLGGGRGRPGVRKNTGW